MSLPAPPATNNTEKTGLETKQVPAHKNHSSRIACGGVDSSTSRSVVVVVVVVVVVAVVAAAAAAVVVVVV